MAHVRAYKNGWRAQIERNGRRASKTFATKREAQAWALQQEAGATALRAGWRTLGQAAQDYLATQTPLKRSPKWEANTLARLVQQLGEDTQLGTITAATIARWRDKRLKTVSGSTVQREANLLRHLLRVARDEWQWIEHDPFKGVKLPKHNPARQPVWPWRLMRRVLRSGRTGKTGEVVRAFHIALHTGLRLGEVLTHQYDATRRVILLPRTKAGRAQEVPVTRRAARLLQRQAPFTVDANEASTLFSKLREDLLITGLTFHDARATALTLLARRMDVMTLARISRHKDLRILLNTYYRETAEQIAARI